MMGCTVDSWNDALNVEIILECGACDVIRIKKMQEGVSMEQWFWPRSIDIMEPVQWRCHPRNHMEKIEEFCKPQANELRARFDLFTTFKARRSHCQPVV